MSVPIDLMYDYIAGYVNHDVIIYRWTPPGSKNLDDLQPLKNYHRAVNETRPVMVCHDQEPLQWDLYNNERSQRWVQDDFCKYWAVSKTSQPWPWDKDHVLQSWVQPNEISNTNPRLILLHSEKNSRALDRAVSLDWDPVHVWSHGLIAQDWFRYAEHDRSLATVGSGDKTFLIYSRAWTGSREYRLWFLHQVVQRGLVNLCTVRVGARDQDHCYRHHRFLDQTWCCVPDWQPEIFSENLCPADASATYDAADYRTHQIEVVLETVIDRTHLTEKTCRALACGKPFILAAGAGSLEYLKSYGFNSFHPWINESYDLETNAQRRLNMVLDEMTRISGMSEPERQRWCCEINRIASENQLHFFSNDFLRKIMNEFSQQYHEILETRHQTVMIPDHWQIYLHDHYPEISNLLGRV